MIILYDKTETKFHHNGLGLLDKNIYNQEHSEIINGLEIFTFSYPIFAPLGLQIEGESIIKIKTPDRDYQNFVVSKINKKNGELTVLCYHIFYKLIDNLIEDTNIVDKSGAGALSQMSGRTQFEHDFQFMSDIGKIAGSRVVRKNVVQFLLDTSDDNCFVNRWGGELIRDNQKVSMVQQRGKNRGVTIRHRKNLLGYDSEVDWTTPVTRIMPKGYDGLLLPEKYVDSPIINSYTTPKIKVIEFPNIKAVKEGEFAQEGAVPLKEAYQMLRDAANQMYEVDKIDYPFANYKVEFVELSKTEEYKDYSILETVYPGDTVNVVHEEEGLSIEAKVISYKYDPLNEKYISIELGDYKESFSNIGNKVDNIQKEIDGMEESFLNKAKDLATDIINAGFGGHVRVYPDRILIMDTDNEMTARRVWQWNLNGFGYSKTGINGRYELAMTMDGSIVADFITTGTLKAELIQSGFNNINAGISIDKSGFLVKGNDKGGMLLNANGLEMLNEKNEIVGSISRSVGFSGITGKPVISGIEYNSHNSSHHFKGWYTGVMTSVFDVSNSNGKAHFRVSGGDIYAKGDEISLWGNVKINGKTIS